MQNNTKIYYKLYLLTKQFYRVVKNFPKEHKYALGRDIIELSWRCLDLSLEANLAENLAKAEKIKELSEAFEKLKMRIRMSQEIRLITIGQLSHLEENYLLEIGKMIGGWEKWAENAGTRERVNGRPKELSSLSAKELNSFGHEIMLIFTYKNLYRAYLDSNKPRVYWNAMKTRLKSEDGIQLSIICRQLKLLANDGKKYATDYANTEGIFRIIQSTLKTICHNLCLNKIIMLL